jgi:uncharacterized protein YjbI with pentapeptide repeats
MTQMALRERWDSGEGRALAAGVSAWLNGVGRAPSALGTILGRVDLRGISLGHLEPPRAAADYGRFDGQRWEGLDFSGARLDHMRWKNMSVRNCRFDNAWLEDLRVWESEIDGTSFARAKLRAAALGTGAKYRRNRWSATDFRLANLRDAQFDSADLSDIDFGNAKLNGVWFTRSRLDRVTFSGVMRDVLFDDRDSIRDGTSGYPMTEVDFSQATFDDVDFQGSRFRFVRFPTHQTVLVVPQYPRAVNEVLAALPSGDDHADSLRAMLTRVKGNLGSDETVGIFVREDIAGWSTESLAQFAFDAFLNVDRDHRLGVRVLPAGSDKTIS